MNTLIIRFIHTTIYSHNMSIWISVSASLTRKIKGKGLLNRYIYISILIKFPNKLWRQLSHHIIQHQQRTVNVDSVNEQKIIIVITWTQFWVSFKLKASSYFVIIMMFLKNTMATFIITTSFKEMHSSRKFLTTKNNKQQNKKRKSARKLLWRATTKYLLFVK